MFTSSSQHAVAMYRLGRHPTGLSSLPDDVLLEISSYLEVEDVFTLRVTNRHLHAFTSSRYVWHQVTHNLCYRLPLAIPPFRARSSIATSEFQTIVKRALRLEDNWRCESPAPTKPPRFLNLTPDGDCVMMLRLLPGGRLFILVTAGGRLTCRDTRDGGIVGEWKHGGCKVHSIDVDVVDDGQAMVLTVSVDRHQVSPMTGEPYRHTHKVHVLRIDVSDDPETGISQVEFIDIMAFPWDSPWWIVSVEGDVIAAYACELTTKPLSQFVVWIANWRTATAVVVNLPETVIELVNWPTLQVVGGQVIIHEERGCSPASLVFPVPDILFSTDNRDLLPHVKITRTLIQDSDQPDNPLQTHFSKLWRNDPTRSASSRPLSLFAISTSTLFSTDGTDPLPHVKITPTLVQDGDNLDNAFQTRFSKLWRNDRTRSASSRPLSLFAISASTNIEAKRIVSVQTFDPFPMPSAQFSAPNAKQSIPAAKVWRHEALVPEAREGLRFTFCLGRYGSFPIWVEECDPPEGLPDGTEYLPELRLMGLFTEYKDGGSHYPKRMAPPEGIELHTLQCLDFDDAEGILCGVTENGVWIIEYA